MQTETPDAFDYAQGLDSQGYIADSALCSTLALSARLQRPLLLEGDPGVGKTALASALADFHGYPLLRLQCYEGIELHQVAFEWNTAAQLLALKTAELRGEMPVLQDLYQQDFLLARPLLQALLSPEPVVLLIDEIDRGDEALEAFLLEILSEWQISIPELGVIRARSQPQVLLTSNATRELSDALRRRCLYHYIDYPDLACEQQILQRHLAQLPATLARQCASLMQALRQRPLRKPPGIAESIDFARAASTLGPALAPQERLNDIRALLPAVLKFREDHAQIDDATLADLVSAAWRAHAA